MLAVYPYSQYPNFYNHMQMPTYGQYQYPYHSPYWGYQQMPYENSQGQQHLYSVPQKVMKAKSNQKVATHLNPQASLFFSGPIPEVDRIFFV